MTTFVEPNDVPDAEWRIAVLEEEVARIEDQLADESRKLDRETGEPLHELEYAAWRARAQDAMYHKKNEVGFLRAWLRRHQAHRIEPESKLMVALEQAMPTISMVAHMTGGFPQLKPLVETYGMVTGSYA